jgi:hypothetical protein
VVANMCLRTPIHKVADVFGGSGIEVKICLPILDKAKSSMRSYVMVTIITAEQDWKAETLVCRSGRVY